mgnify:FL=1
MDKRVLQIYSVWAKDNLEKQIEVSLKTLGIHSESDIKEARTVGDYTIIDGDSNSYPKDLYDKRRHIVNLIKTDGYKAVIEEFAYTWFNRFVALRFMETHDFLPHGFRVLSSRDGNLEPEILKNLAYVKDELKLDINLCNALKTQGKLEELYRYVLFRQCKALSGILPMLFSDENDYLELLLPKILLKGETVLTRLLEIPEEAFLQDVEIIGWMYQFYISVKKDEVFASKKTITKDTLPAVTQLFTPDWIVRYMAENSIGRIWIESYPNSSLKSDMKYYVADPEQTQEIKRKIDAVKYQNVRPEDIKVIEPCCGSGHILVYVFDLLFKMYEEKGYQPREIPSLILKNNIFGLDVDKRASQLASFALIMKARSLNSKFFSESYYVAPYVYEIWDSRLLLSLGYKKQLEDLKLLSESEIDDIEYIIESFRYGKTIGSLLKIKPLNYDRVENSIKTIEAKAVPNLFNTTFLSDGIKLLKRLVKQAKVMSGKYDVMITNPPYIGISSMESPVKDYAITFYPNSKSDMFAMFMETEFVKPNGFYAMINMHSWMFLSSYEKLRKSILTTKEIVNMIHLGAHAFEAIGGEVVQTTSFVIRNVNIGGNGVYFRLVDSSNKEQDFLQNVEKSGGGVRFVANAAKFISIPGSPVAYWISKVLSAAFVKGEQFSKVGSPRVGLQTSDNNRFLRYWYEVCLTDTNFKATDCINAFALGKKWYPHNKGGTYRKWYGNLDYVINYQNNGQILRQTKGAAIIPDKIVFMEAITYSRLCAGNISFRLQPQGCIFDSASVNAYVEESKRYYVLAFLNTKVSAIMAQTISPTINTQPGDIAKLSIIYDLKKKDIIGELTKENLIIAKEEWDSFEESWDFKKHPLI